MDGAQKCVLFCGKENTPCVYIDFQFKFRAIGFLQNLINFTLVFPFNHAKYLNSQHHQHNFFSVITQKSLQITILTLPSMIRLLKTVSFLEVLLFDWVVWFGSMWFVFFGYISTKDTQSNYYVLMSIGIVSFFKLCPPLEQIHCFILLSIFSDCFFSFI